MKKILIAAVGATLAFPAVAQTGRVDATHQGANLFPFAPKARAEQTHSRLFTPAITDFQDNDGSNISVGAFRSLAQNALPSAALVGYLDGPNNQTWYYTGDYTYTDNQISGFRFDFYDATFSKIGSVADNIELQEDETRVAQVSVGPAITKKFFNYDNNYEVMIDVVTNTTAYVNNYRTSVYSITDLAEGANSDCIQTLDGYYVSAINTAQDAWSENFYITFLTEDDTETPYVGDVINVMDYHFVTYKKAGYSGGVSPVLDLRVPGVAMAGADAIPFLATQKNGVPYFSVNRLKYSWYLDPYDYNVDTPTPDNELIVEIYAPASSYASTIDHYSTTRIPLDATDDNLCFLYVGTFMYDGDIDMSRNDDGTPLLYVTRAHSQQGGDEYLYDYEAWDGAKKGEDATATKKYDITQGTEGGYFMADIPGHAPQVMFIHNSGDEYTFQFVNILDGTVENTIPYAFNEGSSLYNMNTLVNRIPSGDSYLYTVPQSKGFSDDNGDCHVYMVFASPEGDVVKVDDINMGQRIDYATIYSAVDAFNPYLFNLDADHEYMVLLKRRFETGSGNQEEFSVISSNPEKGTLLNLGPDDEKGFLTSVSLVNPEGENPKLAVIYVNRIPGNWQYTTTYYDLPLTLFEVGDGSAENPYEISTVGGLMQIKSAPSACFAVVADIDANGTTVSPTNFNFTGNIDGRGHLISNLTLEGRALLPTVKGDASEDGVPTKGIVKDLKFYNVTFNTTIDTQGLIAGQLASGMVTNVHVYNSTINSTGDVGGLVGSAVSYSSVNGCSFNGEISSPDNSVGGILCSTFTSSSVSACAFSGTITGGSEVGGILGSTSANGKGVSNCHVKADITGKNTIGGIVGTAASVPYTNNHVEGTLTATENLRWGGGAKVGGIAGEYPSFVAEEEGAEVTPVIHGNFINLTSITAPEAVEGAYPAQNNTVHRVVGYTRANHAEEVDYDPTTWEPIYGDPLPADRSIRNNYVISTLPVVESAIADDPDTTEGKSVDPSELGRDFFEEQLGFPYGYDVESPWALTSAASPSLYFEGLLLIVNPQSASVEIGEEVAVNVTIHGVEISESLFGDFTCNYDESIIEMTDMFLSDDGLLLTVKGLAAGETDFTVGIQGQTVKCHITVLPQSGVAQVVAAQTAALTFDGRALNAEGSSIEVYNVSGVKVLTGNDTVDTGSLVGGIYIGVARNASGSSTLKFFVK